MVLPGNDLGSPCTEQNDNFQDYSKRNQQSYSFEQVNTEKTE